MNYTILEMTINEIEVKKSRFIAYLFPCYTLDEFKETLEKIKKEHYKAKHFCFAYVFNNEKRGSDDKEPKGTAGIPLLNGLINNNLVNTAVIVVRYFGGTLLGASNLTRTYLKSFEEVYKVSKRVELIMMKKIEVNINYDSFDIFKNYLKNMHFDIINTSFNDKILISFLTPLEYKKEEIESMFFNKIEILEISDYLFRKEI